MAEYHMNLGYISRSGGKSASANAAYIGCATIEEARTGLVFDYSKKQGLLYQEILAPEGCPEWVYDDETLWNNVEAFEDYIAQKRFKGHNDPEKNAKSIEAKEKFLGSCKTAYTATFALPHEIKDHEHLIELSRRIVKECYVKNGLIAKFAIHLDKGNPHFHILSTTRPWVDGTLGSNAQGPTQVPDRVGEIGGQGFSETRFRIDKEKLIEIRLLAAEIANEFAREKGYNYVLDARSYEDRGIVIIPTRHLGPKAYHKHKDESRILQENYEIHRENLLTFFNQPEELVKLVATNKVVFTQKDIEKEIFKRVGGDMLLYGLLKTRLEGVEISSELLKTANDNLTLKGEALRADYEQTVSLFADQMLHHGCIVEVGKNLKDETIFTTQQAVELEESVNASVQYLKELRGKEIPYYLKDFAILTAESRNGFAFSEEQRTAIDYLLGSEGLRVLTGKAGTGKTTVLRPVVEAYKEAGYIPLGAAFQGKVSELLSNDLDIPSYTIDQFRHYWGEYEKLQKEIPGLKGKSLNAAKRQLEKLSLFQLTNRHVIILDEGNMVGGNLWNALLSRVQESGAHLRVVQDTNQIKALYGADISRLVEEKVGSFELNEVHRQKEKWMREASAHLNNHDDLMKGVKAYADHGCLTFKESVELTRYALAEAYVNNLTVSPHELHIALAFQNRDVSDLNEAIHHQLKQVGALGKSLIHDGREFAVGDRIIFTANDHTGWHIKTSDPGRHKSRQKGVKNGTFGEIKSIDEEHSHIEVELKDGRNVLVNLKTYDHIDYGYAMTVNKAESQTFDHVYGLFDRFMSANRTLVWMTRHRLTFQGFISSEQAVDAKGMVDAVGRSEYRPLISDFANTGSLEAELLRRYMTASYEAGNLWGSISRDMQVSSMLASTTQVSPTDHSKWADTCVVDFQAAQFERNQLAGEILENWDNCRTFVNQVGLKKITLEVQAGLKMRDLSEVEIEALQRVEAYRSVASQVRETWEEISEKTLSKTHPLVREHEESAQIRNQLAYEIATFPELHRPFFKITKKEEAYVSYGGEIYEKHPASLKAAQRHSQAYIKAQHQEIFKEKLTSVQKGAFNELMDYKERVRLCGRLAASLKNMSPLIKAYPLKESLDEASKERDFLAFKIINSFEKYSLLLERADVALCKDSQDQLLKYAVFGEVRQLALKHRLAKTFERRLEFADQLYKMVMSEGNRCDKQLYGILRGMDVDLSRLQFERSCFDIMISKGKEYCPFKSIDEVSSAYVSLNDYRIAHREAAQNWNIIKTHSTEKVVSQQNDQIVSLNAWTKAIQAKEKDLSREDLEKVSEELQKKADPATLDENKEVHMKRAANLQTLIFVTREITKAVNGSGALSLNLSSASPSSIGTSTPTLASPDLLVDLQRRHVELMHLQGHLRKGRSGYVEIFKIDHPRDTTWEDLREKKIILAAQALEKCGEVIKLTSQRDYNRIQKEAYEHQIGQVISQYQQTKGEEKAALAAEILSHLEGEGRGAVPQIASDIQRDGFRTFHGLPFEAAEQRRLVKAQLKNRAINFEVIHLYGLFHHALCSLPEKDQLLNPELAQEKSLSLQGALDFYVQAQERFSFLWKDRSEVIEKGLREIKEHYSLQRENLLIQFEDRNPMRPCSLVVDRLIEDTSKLYHQEKEKEDETHIKLETLALNVQEKLQHLDKSFEWGCDKCDLKRLFQEILHLALAKDQIHEKRIELMKNHKFEDADNKAFFISAGQRNKAAYELMKSPLGRVIQDSQDIFPVRDYAERYHQKLERDKRAEEAKHGEILPTYGSSFHNSSQAPLQGFVPQDSEFANQVQPSFFIKKEDVEKALVQNMASFADDIFSSLGEPYHRSRSSATDRRYGKKGHIAVNLKTGEWFDHKANLGGWPLQMLTKLKGFDDDEALKFGATWAGLTPEKVELFRSESYKKEEKRSLEKETEEKNQRIKKAQMLWQRAKSIKGTLAERYLREHRKIEGELPHNLRYLSGYKDSRSGKSYPPCLVAAAKSLKGEVTAVQLTYLDPQTAAKAKIDVVKRSHGVIKGSAVTLQACPLERGEPIESSNILFVAEGVETALSIKEAGVQGTIKASLGLSNISQIVPDTLDTHIIICADHDAPDSPAIGTLNKSVRTLEDKGYQVTVIKPDRRDEDFKDFNDVLKKQGIEGVQAYVKPYLISGPSIEVTLEEKRLQEVVSQKESQVETTLTGLHSMGMGTHVMDAQSRPPLIETSAPKKKTSATKERISSALQFVYEEMKHPAFAHATIIKKAFEKGLKVHGEDSAITYWTRKKEFLLRTYHQNLAKVEKALNAPHLSHFTDSWKDEAREWAKQDPVRVLNLFKKLKDKELYRHEKQDSEKNFHSPHEKEIKNSKSHKEEIHLREIHLKETHLGETYLRFKEISRTLENNLETNHSLREEFKRLGHELSQNKDFMEAIKRVDLQAAKLIEGMVEEQSLSHSINLGRGGYSI